MQAFPEVQENVVLHSAPLDQPQSHVRDLRNFFALSAVASGLGFQSAKFLGMAYGMDEHSRTMLTCLGLAMCIVAAPMFLLFGRKMTIRAGFTVSGIFIFAVVMIASSI